MLAIQRRLPSFETRSVLLFAALALGAAAASHAQTQPGHQAPQASFGPGTSAPNPHSKATTGPAASAGIQAAFDKADANHDGKLSAQEAATLPAMGQQFKKLDKDHDGFLSPAEFSRGAQS